MSKFYVRTLCLFFCITIQASSHSLETIVLGSVNSEQNNITANTATAPRTIFVTATRPASPIQRDNLTCCQILQQTSESYRTDYHEYGLCCCICDHEVDSIANPRVRNCRECTDNCIVLSVGFACIPITFIGLCCYAGHQVVNDIGSDVGSDDIL